MDAIVKIAHRDLKLSQGMDEYVGNKTKKLERFIYGIQEIRVDIGQNKNARNAMDRYRSQITVLGSGFVLRTEEKSDEVRPAFDLAFQKMQSRIYRYKGKRIKKKSGIKSLADDAILEFEREFEGEELPEIVRRKSMSLFPMDEREALEQMKLIDHEDFYLFFNSQNSNVNVLYKRKDGNYGLINTEVA
jgi:putative sigma-54 modulation protein